MGSCTLVQCVHWWSQNSSSGHTKSESSQSLPDPNIFASSRRTKDLIKCGTKQHALVRSKACELHVLPRMLSGERDWPERYIGGCVHVDPRVRLSLSDIHLIAWCSMCSAAGLPTPKSGSLVFRRQDHVCTRSDINGRAGTSSVTRACTYTFVFTVCRNPPCVALCLTIAWRGLTDRVMFCNSRIDENCHFLHNSSFKRASSNTSYCKANFTPDRHQSLKVGKRPPHSKHR